MISRFIFILFLFFASPVFAQNSCDEAKDCKGPLPHFCVACKNGKAGGCAHWACEDHKCLTKTCDIEPTFHQAPSSTTYLKNPYKTDSAIQAGAEIFRNRCSSCHGKSAEGSGNVPSLTHGPLQYAPEGEIFWFIEKGSPENGMPPSHLTKKERWQVVSFLKSGKFSSVTPVEKFNDDTHSPPLSAPFTDFRYEQPGQSHKITVQDLPEPAAQQSVGNSPGIVARPEKALPRVPKGFLVQLYASGLDHPRLIRTAPNGDFFLAESESGKIKIFRSLTKEGKPEKAEVFASGLSRPYGIAFYPSGKNPEWVYIGNTDAVIRFPYHSGDLHASGPAQSIIGLPSTWRGYWT